MLKIIFLLLMSGGIPVAIAMAGSSLIYIWWTGNLMNNAGITNRIYNYALALVGWLKGGLGHVNVVGSVVFAGMSGTAIADAAGLGIRHFSRAFRAFAAKQKPVFEGN